MLTGGGGGEVGDENGRGGGDEAGDLGEEEGEKA